MRRGRRWLTLEFINSVDSDPMGDQHHHNNRGEGVDDPLEIIRVFFRGRGIAVRTAHSRQPPLMTWRQKVGPYARLPEARRIPQETTSPAGPDRRKAKRVGPKCGASYKGRAGNGGSIYKKGPNQNVKNSHISRLKFIKYQISIILI